MTGEQSKIKLSLIVGVAGSNWVLFLEKSPNSQTPTPPQGVTIGLSKLPCRGVVGHRFQTLTVTPALHHLKGGYREREGLTMKDFFVCSLIIRNMGLDQKDALTTHHTARTWSLGKFRIATSLVQRDGFTRESTGVRWRKWESGDLWVGSSEAHRESKLGGLATIDKPCQEVRS